MFELFFFFKSVKCVRGNAVECVGALKAPVLIDCQCRHGRKLPVISTTTPSSSPTEEDFELEFQDNVIASTTPVAPVTPDPVKSDTDEALVLWISVGFMVVFVAGAVAAIIYGVRRSAHNNDDGSDNDGDGQMIPLSDLNSSVTSTGKFFK
jgi:hypothetical protein